MRLLAGTAAPFPVAPPQAVAYLNQLHVEEGQARGPMIPTIYYPAKHL